MGSSMAMGMMTPPVSTDKNISWTVSSGWTEQPASSTRGGSFLATGSNGQKVDISVVPLSDPAGGTLANINRWRGQINLSPIEDQDLSRLTETIKSGTKDMLLVNFVSEQNLIDNKFKKRLVAARKCPHPGIEMPPVRETHKRCRNEKDQGKYNAVIGSAQKFTSLKDQSYKEENERAHHKPCRHVGKWGMKRKTIFMFL